MLRSVQVVASTLRLWHIDAVSGGGVHSINLRAAWRGRGDHVGHETSGAEFSDPASLDDAFTDVSTLLMISVEGDDKERIRLHANAVDAAHRAGVERVIYTSFFDVAPTSPNAVARVHRLTEAHIMASGCAWTMLRNGPYLDTSRKRRQISAGTRIAPHRVFAGDVCRVHDRTDQRLRTSGWTRFAVDARGAGTKRLLKLRDIGLSPALESLLVIASRLSDRVDRQRG